MRIVHISIGSLPPLLSPSGGAIQRRVLELSKAQARLGHQVEAYSMGIRSGRVHHEGVDVQFVACRAPAPWRRLEFQARVLGRLQRAPSLKPEMLHVHSEPESVLVGRMLRVPTVLSYDNFVFRKGRSTPLWPLYRHLLKGFDRLLPCSEYCRTESTAYWQFDQALLSMLPNGVSRQQFFPDPEAGLTIRDELGLRDAPVLLYVGRVCEQKGTDTLLSAYKHLRAHLPEARLVIAGPIEQFSYSDGTGPREDEWRRRMDLEGAIYLGRVHEKRLLGVYNMADLFVMPTRELEMFGMAAIEAQACGVPVLASDHGGLRETVPDECGGRFPVGDAAALAAAARALLSDPTIRAVKARSATANAARYEWGAVASTLDSFYELAVASSRRRRARSARGSA